MFTASPIFRISIGLILLTISLLLVSDLLGLTPDQNRAELGARKTISESLAVQVSTDISVGRTDAVVDALRVLQERNDSILSIALRTKDGQLIAMAGDHVAHWEPAEDDRSTSSHVLVPIHMEQRSWGTLEISFVPLSGVWSGLLTGGSISAVIAFMSFAGFIAYWLFLKRALNELDPSAVVPDRVRTALDVLAEGLVVLDRGGRIVLVNQAFQRQLGQREDALVGSSLASLAWRLKGGDVEAAPTELPWQQVLDSGDAVAAAQLGLTTPMHTTLWLAVNCSPVTSSNGTVRGVVVTFDDMTELEHKNADLERALAKLEHTQHEITRQNTELQILATRDGLTGVLNRRSFFDGMATLMTEVADDAASLSCIMADIDHFKSINDRFGHATGDKVIKNMARILTECARAEDLVGRYGGEEFCVVLPVAEEGQAAAIAEKMRVAISEGASAKLMGALRVSASFGVATSQADGMQPSALIDLADKALYEAKERGRNRVVRWSEIMPLAEGQTRQIVTKDAPANLDPGQPDVRGGQNQDMTLVADNARLLARIAELEVLVQEQPDNGSVSIDQSTGLPNRILLLDRIRQAIHRSRRLNCRVAVLAMEVDTVKFVRGSHGTTAADKLMKMVAARLKQSLRDMDTVAITGGRDVEASISGGNDGAFTILLSDMKEAESTTWIVQRLFGSLTEPVELEGREILLDASIGASLFPDDGEDPDTLVSNAVAALREATVATGRHVCLFFNRAMNERSVAQLSMESQLHWAIERGELYLEYQPAVDVRTGRVRGFEALLRWRHPGLGLVRPDRFIPVAEHAGLIVDIGEWVIQTALHQLKSWHEMGNQELVVAINFSALQFRQEDLVKQVVDALGAAGLAPDSLVMEITESALIENLDAAAAVVEGLSQAGVCIALDDFGTGYSSLDYLKRFPIDVIKIDRSFLPDFPAQPHDTQIVAAIIALAHSLGLRVVAEGVETERQLQVLQNLQCDEIQGYLFSKPISREQATDLLNKPASIRRLVNASGRQGVAVSFDRQSAISGVVNELPKQGFRA